MSGRPCRRQSAANEDTTKQKVIVGVSTSPRRGEVGLRSNPGEGPQRIIETKTPHPDRIFDAIRPLPTGEVNRAPHQVQRESRLVFARSMTSSPRPLITARNTHRLKPLTC